MTISQNIKTFSNLKANAAKLVEELKANGDSCFIVQNGEAVMVVKSVQEYKQTQETMALYSWTVSKPLLPDY